MHVNLQQRNAPVDVAARGPEHGTDSGPVFACVAGTVTDVHTPERSGVASDPSDVDPQEVFAFQKKLVHGCIVLQVDDDGVQDLTAQCTEGVIEPEMATLVYVFEGYAFETVVGGEVKGGEMCH